MREYFPTKVPNLWQTFESMTPWGVTKTYQLVEKDKNESILYVNVPGYTRDDLSIEMNAGTLSIAGNLPDERNKTSITPTIELQFAMNNCFLVEDANLEHGLLTVRLVRHQKTDSVKIPIRSS